MALRRLVAMGALLVVSLLLVCGVAAAAKRYPDPVGDVKAGTGPDITAVTVSNTKTKLTFAVRFAGTPPLRVSQSQGWIDMLLVSVDVPPLGPRPAVPGGEWRGANFALGTHGPAETGMLVRLAGRENRLVTRFRIVTTGATLTFSLPRRAFGNPAWFTFTVAAAREMEEESSGAEPDFAPARGTYRYALTG